MKLGKLLFVILVIIASGCGLGIPEPSSRTRTLGDLGGDEDVEKTDTDVTDEEVPGDEDDADDDAPSDDDLPDDDDPAPGDDEDDGDDDPAPGDDEDDGDDDPAPGDEDDDTDDDPAPVDGSPCPATGACRIMPLGDSITDGHGWPGGYRIELWQYFQTNGKSVDFVGSLSNGPGSLGDKDHEGHSGWSIDQITDIAADRVTTHQPHIVLLHIGTNDIFGPPINLIPKLEALLDVIAATRPTTHIIVSSLFPLTSTWNSNQRLEVYNAGIPGLVATKAALGRPISFVDIYSAVSQSDLSSDEIHPSLTGYDKMAGVWWGALAPMLP